MTSPPIVPVLILSILHGFISFHICSDSTHLAPIPFYFVYLFLVLLTWIFLFMQSELMVQNEYICFYKVICTQIFIFLECRTHHIWERGGGGGNFFFCSFVFSTQGGAKHFLKLTTMWINNKNKKENKYTTYIWKSIGSTITLGAINHSSTFSCSSMSQVQNVHWQITTTAKTSGSA